MSSGLTSSGTDFTKEYYGLQGQTNRTIVQTANAVIRLDDDVLKATGEI